MASDANTSAGNYGARTTALLSAPLVITVSVFLLYPLIYLIELAFGGKTALANFIDFVGNSSNLYVVWITFADSAITGVICVALGSLIAWSLKTSTSHLVKMLTWAALILPFCMGTVTKLYGLLIVLENSGVVNTILGAIGLIDAPLSLLYNQLAVIFGLSYQMVPFAVVPLYVAFQTIDTDLVLAAEGLGSSRLRAIIDVVIPLSWPSLIATWAIIYILCSGFFLTPIILGGITSPFASSLITISIFQFFDVGSAAVLGCILLLQGLLVVGTVWVTLGYKYIERAVAV